MPPTPCEMNAWSRNHCKIQSSKLCLSNWLVFLLYFCTSAYRTHTRLGLGKLLSWGYFEVTLGNRLVLVPFAEGLGLLSSVKSEFRREEKYCRNYIPEEPRSFLTGLRTPENGELIYIFIISFVPNASFCQSRW